MWKQSFSDPRRAWRSSGLHDAVPYRNGILTLAQVVCGSKSIAEVPEQLTVQKEVVLNVVSFTNHPHYNVSKGPVGGYDIAVYKVDDSPLQAKGTVSLASGI